MPSSLGPAEILVILVVALIVLGPKKLPEAGRQVGKTIAEIRKWSQGFQDEIRNVIDLDDGPPTYPTTPGPQPTEVPPDTGPRPAAETVPLPVADASTLPDVAGNGHVPGAVPPGAASPDPPGPPAGEPPHL